MVSHDPFVFDREKNETSRNQYGGRSERLHQTLCITSIDFQRRSLFGYVKLRVIPLVNGLTKIKLNCKQCRIIRICLRDERKTGDHDWFDAGFQYDDPGKTVCSHGKKRNLDYFVSCQQSAVIAADPDMGGGELTVRIPKEVMGCVLELKVFQVSIEFALEDPGGGVQFVTPDGEGSFAQRSAHMFTYSYANSSRLWFPCVDSYSEVCPWSIDITVDKDMTAVSCGDLVEQVYTPDERRKTYHYVLNIPTSAPNIAMAVGPFEVHVDPVMPEVAHFCLPGLLPILKHTTCFLHEVFEVYEDYLSCRYPYTYYKQVFVDQAYCDKLSYASMTIFNTNILHSPHVIDQAFISRKLLAQALAEQFFGCYVSIQTWNDAWLAMGISGYLYGLYVKKAFGNNEYRHWIMQETMRVCQYEIDGPGVPPLHASRESAADSSSTGGSEHWHGNVPQLHPHLCPGRQLEVSWSKSHLVLRMIEIRIGQEALLQVFNKLLSLANTVAQPKADLSVWGNLLLSTSGFLKSISTVSGKDINMFLDQWVCRSGIAKFHGSFVFNRKRNIVELDIKQDLSKGTVKYLGPLTVCIQELDGSFNHTLQIEDISSHHEIPCHSKSRRNKKKKIPLMTGEEVDINLDSMDSESPVLWIRIDPEVMWLRHVTFEQPDYMWQYQLRHERDVMAQSQAILALERFPTQATRETLMDIISQIECFFRVRMEACYCLAKVASTTASSWTGHTAMLSIFRKLFGSQSCPQIVRYNDFSCFTSYFLQKAFPLALASVRTVHSHCPREVLQFVLDLIKYNDNRLNKFSDSYYLSALIEALGRTVTPGVSVVSIASDGKQIVKLKEFAQQILGEATRHLNLEKLLPSYRFAVSVSCLKVLRTMQINGHVPACATAFKYYATFGHFEDVRQVAIDCLVDFTKTKACKDGLEYLLDIVENDPLPFIRHYTLRSLADCPPFTRKSSCPLNSLVLVERLWQFINYNTACDARLRSDAVELYSALWGRLTPTCVPAQGMGIVIDLKERKIMNLSGMATSPIGSASEESTASKKNRKRKSLHPSSPAVPDLASHMDSPGTPKSAESGCSDSSKLRVKIKLGNEESGAESGSEPRVKNENGSGTEHKKHKKKKKKHKHREEKERRKPSTSSSNYDSPLNLESSNTLT